jgi:predicted PurR-regulated permease PerM
MTRTTSTNPAAIPLPYQIASWILMGAGLLTILELHLLAALLAGLLVFQLVHLLASALHVSFITSRNMKLFVVAMLAIVIISLLMLAGFGIAVFLRKGPDNLATLLNQLAATVDDLRHLLPAALSENLPSDTENFKTLIAKWFREHASEVRTLGTDTLRAFAHILIGLIIGGLVALHEVVPVANPEPFQAALTRRVELLADAFRRILFAQVPISAINTTLTAVYLLLVLPYFGIHLPFAKTLIAITFIAGLLPVVGNLISNTVIFLVSLSLSFTVAIGSLAFLIVIHKLEYFLNARIVGARINARAWELLIAMLVFEAAFGVAGLLAAPIVYAYVKQELTERGMIRGKPQ